MKRRLYCPTPEEMAVIVENLQANYIHVEDIQANYIQAKYLVANGPIENSNHGPTDHQKPL